MVAVLVLGMHRSGTSLIAHMLDLAGAYTGGADELMAADESNSKGYWERLDLIELNESLIHRLGGVSYDPPALPADSTQDGRLPALIDEAQEFVATRFAQKPFWAMKDPRLAVLMPIWKEAVPGARYLLCVRNPLDVVASMGKRDGFDPHHVAALWHIYTLRALHYTAPESRLILNYEDTLSDPEAAAADVLERIQAPDLEIKLSAASIAAQSVDKRLEHHSHTLEDVLESEVLLPPTKELYCALVKRDTKGIQAASISYASTMPVMHCIAHAYSLLHDLQPEVERMQHEVERMAGELQHAQDILDSRTHRLAAKAARLLIGLRGSSKPAGSESASLQENKRGQD